LASFGSRLSSPARVRGLRAAGVAIILLSAGAALLPAGKSLSSDVIGALLIAAGLIETVAGSLRSEARPAAMAAGIVTAIAGLLFEINPQTHFSPTVALVIGWLLVRSIILAIGSREAGGSVRTWTALSAGMDFLLAALLIAGLSISTIIVSLFGPTEELVASFAWVLAASFVVNGLLQLEVADCEHAAVTTT
jgi:predicted membrane channel-forming protein YqfA (hemolysin III family)